MNNDIYYLFVDMMEKQQYVEVVSCHDSRYPDRDIKTLIAVPQSHNFTHFRFLKPNWRLAWGLGEIHIIPAQNIQSMKKATYTDYSKK